MEAPRKIGILTPNRRFLDPALVAKISVENRYNPSGGPTVSIFAEAWVWSFLKACLAPVTGYDEARETINLVQLSMAIEQFRNHPEITT